LGDTFSQPNEGDKPLQKDEKGRGVMKSKEGRIVQGRTKLNWPNRRVRKRSRVGIRGSILKGVGTQETKGKGRSTDKGKKNSKATKRNGLVKKKKKGRNEPSRG